MEAHVNDRYKDCSPRKIFWEWQRQVFIFISLYASAVLGWIEEFCAALPFNAFAAACTHLSPTLNPELSLHLVEQRRRLLVWEPVIHIIEEEYFHAAVPPTEWRRLLDCEQLRFGPTDAGASRSELTEEKVPKPGRLLEEARAIVKILLATACSHAKHNRIP